jgi:hypothetical protein
MARRFIYQYHINQSRRKGTISPSFIAQSLLCSVLGACDIDEENNTILMSISMFLVSYRFLRKYIDEVIIAFLSWMIPFRLFSNEREIFRLDAVFSSGIELIFTVIDGGIYRYAGSDNSCEAESPLRHKYETRIFLFPIHNHAPHPTIVCVYVYRQMAGIRQSKQHEILYDSLPNEDNSS